MGLFLFFAVSIVFSFLCSMWEAVLLSVTPSFVQLKSQEGGTVGTLLKDYKSNIDKPLAAILTLNTIAHTVGAIGVGVQAAKIFGESYITHYVVPVLMTLAILILSELIPKTLGANNWKNLSGFTVKSLNIIITILYPLVWLSQIITKSLKKNKSESVLSRSQFEAMTTIGEQEGIFKEEESTIIRNLLKFNEVRAEDVMTPRTVVKAAPESMSIQEFYDTNSNLRFSRIPLYDQTKDQISGYFLKDKMLAELVDQKGEKMLGSIKRSILINPESMTVPDLFAKMVEKKEHISLIVDEFGGMAGVVTMEDVIETLLGLEIVDEFDNEPDMRSLARKNWENRAKRFGLLENDLNSNNNEQP